MGGGLIIALVIHSLDPRLLTVGGNSIVVVIRSVDLFVRLISLDGSSQLTNMTG